MQKEPAARDNFLYLTFRNLYGSELDLPASFDFQVDDRLLLVRRKEFKQGEIVAIALPPPSANNIASVEKWTSDAQLILRTYLYLCSLVSGKHAEPLWFSWREQKPEELFGRAEEQTGPTSDNNDTTIPSSDFLNFLDFSRKLFKKYYWTVHEFGFLKVALESYFNSDSNTLQSVSSQFINACISLEALYNEGSSDIRYKISHRLAFILGLDGFPPIITFHNAETIYKQRNNIVHGDKDNRPGWGYSELARSYARRSCICFLIICSNRLDQTGKKRTDKGNLLEEIDEAMLDIDRRNILEQEIVNGIREDSPPKMKYGRTEWEFQTEVLDMVSSHEEISGSMPSGTDWFAKPVAVKPGGTVAVHFTAEKAIAPNQLEYTFDEWTHRYVLDDNGSITSSSSAATRYHKHKIQVGKANQFNIRQTTGGAVTITFCRVYQPYKEK